MNDPKGHLVLHGAGWSTLDLIASWHFYCTTLHAMICHNLMHSHHDLTVITLLNHQTGISIYGMPSVAKFLMAHCSSPYFEP